MKFTTSVARTLMQSLKPFKHGSLLERVFDSQKQAQDYLAENLQEFIEYHGTYYSNESLPI